MQVTHEQARRLIQFQADTTLAPGDRHALSAHLSECSECRSFAQGLREVEDILVPLMKRQWSARPIPLSLAAVAIGGISKRPASALLTIRNLGLAVFLAVFMFGAWQLMASNPRNSRPQPLGIAAAPTPSLQSTSTRIVLDNCELILYTVRQGDTLAGIARRFSVTREEILAANSLENEVLRASMKLHIPLCSSTPTGTASDAATHTTTYTPPLRPAAATPDG